MLEDTFGFDCFTKSVCSLNEMIRNFFHKTVSKQEKNTTIVQDQTKMELHLENHY